MLGWWMVHTTVRPVSTVFRTARITIAAARASNPGSGQGNVRIGRLRDMLHYHVSTIQRCKTGKRKPLLCSMLSIISTVIDEEEETCSFLTIASPETPRQKGWKSKLRSIMKLYAYAESVPPPAPLKEATLLLVKSTERKDKITKFKRTVILTSVSDASLETEAGRSVGSRFAAKRHALHGLRKSHSCLTQSRPCL